MIPVSIVLVVSLFPGPADASRPNVLFIAVDDLRPELACYGATHIHSPNIDALAATGRLFLRAYCQQAVCNPSRTSLMTGMRPDSIGVTGNHLHFRSRHPDVVTLPQHFKTHGYHAAAIGKLYHGVFPDGASVTKWDTMGDPQSWSVPAIRFGPRYYYTEKGIAAAKLAYQQIYTPKNAGVQDWTQKLLFGPATEAPDVPDSTLYDGQVADAAVAALGQLKHKSNPFFLAVGFIKPHSPYIAPQKYFNIYKHVTLPARSNFPIDAPAFAGHHSGELRRYTDQPKSGTIPDEMQRRVRQAYFACVSYIDAQIGRVLAELDRCELSDNTIVILYGDHGYHLGEQGMWGKTTNFELDTRVPLIVRVPDMKDAGKSSMSLVELVDLYPTLSELADLPVGEHLEGQSFAPILDAPEAVSKSAAFSQFPRGDGMMGYSVRTEMHRLTQWVSRQTGEVRATELYDYADGPVESENTANAAPELRKALSFRLTEVFPRTLPSALTPSDASVTQSGADDTVPVAGFENTAAGAVDRFESALGTWKSVVGKVVIDDRHAATGKQCLQITGGEKSSIVLQLAESADRSGNLTFRAERWTRRTPFSFRIEKNNGDGWTEIFDGDRDIRVGRPFLSHVKIPLGDDNVNQLRFSVTSPPKTGILIDDVRIAPARPQKIVNAEIVPLVLPALIGNQTSPLVKLKVETSGQLNPISLTQLRVKTDDTTDSADLSSVRIYYGGDSEGSALTGTPVALRKVAGRQTEPFEFSIPASSCQLVEGTNYVWIACGLSGNANPDHQIGATCDFLGFSNGETIRLNADATPQRVGVAVRKRGQDGIHTCRIPGLATTNRGTLIGVYDVRRRGGGDLPGDIDVGMSRSTDGGRTWEPMKVIMDMGDDPQWRYDGVGDPAVLADKTTGTIWVAGTWSHGDRSWRGSGPGLTPEETGQLMLVRSDDDGVTWSHPINITEQVKRPEWCFLLQGPGKGITMRDGTIVFAAQYQDPPEADRLPHSTIIYSKDHGKTWHAGTGAFDDTTEAQVVELDPGVLMLNCRYNRKSVRVVMTSRDMGATWQKHETSERSLIEPGSCMASLINADREVGRDLGGWLLFSNPDSTRGRHHITIKASPDTGLTWPKAHRLLLDEGAGAGYSCMSMIDAETIGILYEGSQAHMTFQRIKLKDVVAAQSGTSHAESSAPPPVLRQSLRLPRVFSNHMVLQAGVRTPVWGSATAGATVTVTFGDEELSTVAEADGHWSLQLSPRAATGKPARLEIIAAGERIQFADILVGEVWICAGQSNMEWPVSQSANAAQELTADEFPAVRLLNLSAGARGSSGAYSPDDLERLVPDRFCKGEWKVADAASVASFSAVAWYFGQHLQQELDVPVGLICPAIGGTPIEAWIARDVLEADPDLQGIVNGNWLDNERLGRFCRERGQQNLLHVIQAGETIPRDELGPNHSFKPGFMWSAGIQPLLPYAIRGAIWYQGESNAETFSRVREHGRLFPLLIRDWRKQWGQDDFPFLYVQLPALNRPEWPRFRESQRRALSQLRNVGMAVTIDTGHPTNVHPIEKQQVGQRLAQLALGETYGRAGEQAHSGPLLNGVRRKGHTIVLSFDHVGRGLTSMGSQPLRHFQLCGADSVFHPAVARIIDGDKVEVSNPEVPEPRHVRYGWHPYPDPPVNFFNRDGLPASPFSTENEEALFHRREQQPESEASTDGRPNILLIVGEDHGCELSCYGDPVIQTPHIDGLAAEGVLFENGYVTQSVCSPSRSTIFTGLYPHQNGQLGLATHQYEWFQKWPTTYSLLKMAGYRTGLIGKTHVNPADAVEAFVDFRFQSSSNFAKKDVADYAVKAGEFFEADDQPFFMTVNYPDAHWPLQGQVDGLPGTQVPPDDVVVMPYIGEQTPRMREVVRNYYDCMLRLDACVGQLLRQLETSGKADNTLVVFIGDHGAQMARGKVTVYEGGMRVPYIARWPTMATPGRRSTALVSTIDLLPTFLDAADIQTPAGLPGKSLRPLINGTINDDSFREYLACERNCDAARHTFPQRTIRNSRYKLIHSPVRDRQDPAARYYRDHGASHWSGCLSDEELAAASQQTKAGYARWLNPPKLQLYDLTDDPHEWTDLSTDPAHAAVKQQLVKALQQWQQDTSDPLADADKLSKLLQESDAVYKSGRRSPKDGWKYLKYLRPRVLDVNADSKI
jgi:sialidase-1